LKHPQERFNLNSFHTKKGEGGGVILSSACKRPTAIATTRQKDYLRHYGVPNKGTIRLRDYVELGTKASGFVCIQDRIRVWNRQDFK